MKNNLTTLKAAMACALLAVAPAFVACSDDGEGGGGDTGTQSALTVSLSLIQLSEPTRPLYISYAVFCLKKKKPHK